MLTRAERLRERETIIRWDGQKDVVNLFTASPAIKRKEERAGHRVKKASKVRRGETGWSFVIPYHSLMWSVRLRKTTGTRHGFGVKGGI